MNITPFDDRGWRRSLGCPRGLPCVHHRCRRRDHASGAARTSLSDGEDVTGSRSGGTSNSDPELSVRLPGLKSP
jgi:hypothetical protein